MNFQEDLYQLVQKCKETINPFSSSEEDAGSDVQLVVDFANKWNYKEKYEELKTKLDETATRSERDKQEVIGRSIMSVIRDVLPALDDAYQIRSFIKEEQYTFAIDSMILNLEKILLSRNGSIIFPGTGEKFDPSMHIAVTAETVKSTSKNPCQPGSYIFQTLRKGYIVLGKVIRHAEVKVFTVV